MTGPKNHNASVTPPLPPRIVIVDDEPMLMEFAEMVIREWFKEATVLKFEEGEAAWEELMKNPPNLLMTDMNRTGMNGWIMLPMLAEMRVKYPILVVSGNAKEADVYNIAGYGLTLEFLEKPYTHEAFNEVLAKHFGPRTASF